MLHSTPLKMNKVHYLGSSEAPLGVSGLGEVEPCHPLQMQIRYAHNGGLSQPVYLCLSFPFHFCSQVTPALPTEGPNHHLSLVNGLSGGIRHADLHLLAG